jgi:hypothetical protein
MSSTKQSALRKRLTEAARQGPSEYTGEYIRSFDEVLQVPAHREMVGEVRSGSTDEARLDLKVALLYNDTSLLDLMLGTSEISFRLLQAGFFESIGKSPRLTANFTRPPDQALLDAIDRQDVMVGFAASSGDDVAQLLNDAAPLIETGRLLLRPPRILMYSDGTRNEKGGRNLKVLDTAPNSMMDVWEVEETAARRETIIGQQASEGLGATVHAEAKALCVPYIDGVSLDDYVKILEDEDDIIVEFRQATKSLIEEVRSGSQDIEAFQRDVVEPRLAKIERQFRKITDASNARTRTRTLQTAAATLVALAAGGPLAAAVPLVAGGGVIADEMSKRRERTAELKDDPLYLLWRLRRSR